MSEEIKKRIQDEAIIHWEKDVNGNSGQSFITGAEFGYQLAQEEFKQSEEKQTIKLYVKDQSQQGQNPTDPKESGEVEKPVVSMYDPPAEITYIQVNGKEYVPIDPNQDELWEELDNTCTDANCNLIITEAKKRYRITRVTS